MTYLDDYARIDAVNISTLKDLSRLSPLHYRHRLRTPREDSPALAFGRLVHCAVLEPDALLDRYVVEPDFGDLRTKAARADRDAWREEHATAETISADWGEKAQRISDAVRMDPVAAPYLNGGLPEVTLTWQDAETDVACKGRVDWLSFADRTDRPDCIVGLKTTRAILQRKFASSAVDYGYPLQWAFYSDGYEAAHGVFLPTVEIVVESELPHDVIVYTIPEEVIDYGRDCYRDALQRLVSCRRTDIWPGVSDGKPMQFVLPRWAARGEDDELTGLEF